MPDDTKLLGYVVSLTEQNEFLGEVIEDAFKIARAYTQEAALAKVFVDFFEAEKQAKAIAEKYKVAIAVLFETENNLAVAEINA